MAYRWLKRLVATAAVSLLAVFTFGCSETSNFLTGTEALHSKQSRPDSSSSLDVVVFIRQHPSGAYYYDPDNLTITEGTTVIFRNDTGVNHSVSGLQWGCGIIPPGQDCSHTFDDAGTYNFACLLTGHPETGTINVEAI